jgi:hypothetical protein
MQIKRPKYHSTQPIIYHVPSEEQWPMSNQPIIEPPKLRVALKRPWNIRFRGVEEPKNPNTMRKGGNKNQCGHYKK